jgi:hypothetical protein
MRVDLLVQISVDAAARDDGANAGQQDEQAGPHE